MQPVRPADESGTPVPSRDDDSGTRLAAQTDDDGTKPKVFFPKKLPKARRSQGGVIFTCTLFIGRLSILGAARPSF
jgi:hypothetical protein